MRASVATSLRLTATATPTPDEPEVTGAPSADAVEPPRDAAVTTTPPGAVIDAVPAGSTTAVARCSRLRFARAPATVTTPAGVSAAPSVVSLGLSSFRVAPPGL